MLPVLCDAITPSLLIALLALPWFYRGGLERRRLVLLSAAQTAVGLTATYSLMAIDNATGWWPRWGMDYSTHSAFALSLALPLVVHHHWAWVFLIGFYGLCMQLLHYHSWADMLTTALAWAAFCLPIIYAIQQPWVKKRPSTKNTR
ncbi:MAG TPA: hypothetical protein PKE57_04195 [Cellvibrionaceae bacterium]|nr:hypothetical protein [Cellvibrionaceae bacterium]HMW46983.1 hypothetical protein [Cellvibrionaceae bacterium]HMW70659.1 hypothetical protein [Cellvibrionaceae bacterium]HMY37740.1 hypothetical protein [Marinagarivorans sp.]HNG58183.1 hypothetical protein [Cellvibrionaceae bacterium]